MSYIPTKMISPTASGRSPVLDTDQITATTSPTGVTSPYSPTASLLSTPSVSPEPAYIASKEAGQIVTQEVLATFHQAEDVDVSDLYESSLSQMDPSALLTLNLFLDRVLWNVLAAARSTSLQALRSAVSEVLRPRLAADAIEGANDELIELVGDEAELEEFEDPTYNAETFDVDMTWRRARLRCMVYTRLGTMEEEDEERHIEVNGLDSFADGRRLSGNNGFISPPIAIWLTAIVEHVGESVLIVATEAAYRRSEKRYGRGMRGQPLHPGVVTVTDSDLDKVAFNPILGRLWRAWRKAIKRPSISRTMSIDSLRHRRGDSRSTVGVARKASSETLSSLHKEPVREVDEKPATGEAEAADLPTEPVEVDPASVPLPIGENDVDEIEVPGYNAGIDSRHLHPQRAPRPTSLLVPQATAELAAAGAPELRGLRHMRSQSLPNARRPSAEMEFAAANGAFSNIDDAFTGDSENPSRSSLAPEPSRSGRGSANGEIFSRLSDYSTTNHNDRGRSADSKRRSRVSQHLMAKRRSRVSEFGGPEDPLQFESADYRVEPHEVEARMLSPQVIAPTPTVDTMDSSTSTRSRSGLRENRPVSIAIAPGMLSTPQPRGHGDISPMEEHEYPESGEVSPLDPSDDEESVSIAGLDDAKQHMGVVNPPEPQLSDDPYGQYQPAAAVSPITPPEEIVPIFAQRWPDAALAREHEIPPPAQTQPTAPKAAQTVPSAPTIRQRADEPTTHRGSDEKKREAIVMPDSYDPSHIMQKEGASMMPEIQQRPNFVAPPMHQVYESVPQDVAEVSLPIQQPPVAQAPVQASLPAVAPAPFADPLRSHRVPSPSPPTSTTPPPPRAPGHTANMSQQQSIPRKEVPPESKHAHAPSITPLQLKSNSFDDPASPPQASKLLERRRQLPHVDTAVPDRAGVQRLTPSPQSADGISKQLPPPRSMPEQMYSTAPLEQPPPVGWKSASRKPSRSGEEVFGHKASRSSSIDRSKDFDQLVQSGETIQYTLTPQNIRSYQTIEMPPEIIVNKPSSIKERARGLSGSSVGLLSGSKPRVGPAPQPSLLQQQQQQQQPAPPSAGIPVRIPPGATLSGAMRPGANNSGLAPREAKVDNMSMREFANFFRDTGPSDMSSDPAPMPTKVVRGPKPVLSRDIAAKPTTASMPGMVRSPNSPKVSSDHQAVRPPSTAGSKRSGPKLVARDAQTTSRSNSDLIDFIREGPPMDPGAHRIPRTVAPFRTTMDSDDMRGAATNGGYGGRYAGSVNSTQESFNTNSVLSIANSHTGLLANSQRSGGGMMEGLQEEPMMPQRKRVKPRDPYAIDISDEEDADEEEEQGGTPRASRGAREESLAEFLSSQRAPPELARPMSNAMPQRKMAPRAMGHGPTGSGSAPSPGSVSSLGRPIGQGPGMAAPRPRDSLLASGGGRRTETLDLADFLMNSGPPQQQQQPPVARVSIGDDKKGKGGFGKMFGSARKAR